MMQRRIYHFLNHKTPQLNLNNFDIPFVGDIKFLEIYLGKKPNMEKTLIGTRKYFKNIRISVMGST